MIGIGLSNMNHFFIKKFSKKKKKKGKNHVFSKNNRNKKFPLQEEPFSMLSFPFVLLFISTNHTVE